MRMMTIQPERVRDAFSESRVVGVWLFGSAKEGEAQQDRDIDIAVLFKQKPDLDELTSCRGRLQKALEFDEVDLVVLNDASPVLRFEALSGKRLLCWDEAQCAVFASLTAREYEDEMAMCRRWLKVG